MIPVILFLILGNPTAEALRAETIANMGLNKPFLAYTIEAQSILTVGDQEFPNHTIDIVDGTSPRWSHGTDDKPRGFGFDGNAYWESPYIASQRPADTPTPTPDQLQRRAQHEWWLNIPILLTDIRLAPQLLTSTDGLQGFQFLNPIDGARLAEVYIKDGFPVKILCYRAPNDQTGDQRTITLILSDYKQTGGRFLPHRIVVEDSFIKQKVESSVGVTETVKSWTFHTQMDPIWFTAPEGSVFR